MPRYELLTNEWISAADKKPWKGRKVLCRYSDGDIEVLSWNGFFWEDQRARRVWETVARRVTHFYIFEKFNED